MAKKTRKIYKRRSKYASQYNPKSVKSQSASKSAKSKSDSKSKKYTSEASEAGSKVKEGSKVESEGRSGVITRAKTLREKVVSKLGPVFAKTNRVFWLLVLVFLMSLILGGLNARLGGAFANISEISITYEYAPELDKLQGELQDLGIEVVNLDASKGNVVLVRTDLAGKLTQDIVDHFTSQTGVISASVYRVQPVNQVRIYYSSLLGTLMLGGLLALLIVLIVFRKESRVFQLKLLAMLMAIPVIFLVVMSGLGVLISQLNIITFNPATFDLLVGSFALLTMLMIYFIAHPKRKQFVKLIYGER